MTNRSSGGAWRRLPKIAMVAGCALLQACGNDKGEGSNTPANGPSGPTVRVYKDGEPITSGLANAFASARTIAGRGAGIQNTGDPVGATDYPWQVGLKIFKNDRWWRCGGTLVAPQYVLTAAHCLDTRNSENDPQKVVVTPGMIEVYHGTDGYAAGPALAADPNWIPQFHPRWKSNFAAKKYLYDAAIVRLAQPINGATPAPVQTGAVSTRAAIVSGWGKFNASSGTSNALRAVALTTIDSAICAREMPVPHNAWVDAATLCTQTPRDDACGGDSGGPLVIGSRARPQLIGIVSWGPPLPCAVAGPSGSLVGAYTRGSSIAAWVAQTTGVPGSVTNLAPAPLMRVNSRPSAGGLDR